MSDLTITCTECGAELELSESLAAPLLDHAESEYKRKLAAKDREIAKTRENIKAREDALKQAEANMDAVIERRLATEKKAITQVEVKRAREKVLEELQAEKTARQELESDLQNVREKLNTSQRAEADFLKKQRDLDQQKASLELQIQQRVNNELTSSKDAIRKSIEAEVKIEVREKDIELGKMRAEIASLKLKSAQTPQQLKGEAYEREISETLKEKFPFDTITRVAKGKSGADCLHEVYSAQGKLCGTILWESKRTQNWSDGWITKLKTDQRTEKADVAAIVTQSLPRHIETFDLHEGIWVSSLECLLPVAASLRNLLIEIASTKRANDGLQDKATLVYQYVTSSAFKQRVQAMTEAFTEMQADLFREQTAIKKIWSKREAQLTRFLDATTGMYGDLQGIAGSSVPEIEGISLEMLGSGE